MTSQQNFITATHAKFFSRVVITNMDLHQLTKYTQYDSKNYLPPASMSTQLSAYTAEYLSAQYQNNCMQVYTLSPSPTDFAELSCLRK
jgi:hypothetical protein